MSKKKQTLLLGAHMSISGGPDKALERGESIGCTAIQIFTKSNRQWKAKPLTPEMIQDFKNCKKKSSVLDVIAHASYLINLGSSTPSVEKQSTEALKDELVRCEQLGIKYLVLHPGSAGTHSRKKSIEQIARNIDDIFNKTKTSTHILIEIMAGQGSIIGSAFQELAEIRSLVENKKKVGICFDTCHAFAAGYNFSSPRDYQQMWDDFDKTVGIQHIKAIHMNDSKKELDSHVDRHEHIGKGKIGLEAFKLIMNDPRFFDIPKILETPKEKDLEEDVENMKTLTDLLTPKTKKLLNYK